MRCMGKLLVVGLLGLVVTSMILWGMGARYHSPLSAPLRSVLAAVCGLAPAGALLGLPHRQHMLLAFVLVWDVLVGWWSPITPSNEPIGKIL